MRSIVVHGHPRRRRIRVGSEHAAVRAGQIDANAVPGLKYVRRGPDFDREVVDRARYERLRIGARKRPRGVEPAAADLLGRAVGRDIRDFDDTNKRLKSEVLATVDQEDLKRRDQQATLLAQIKQRTPVAA